MTINAIAVSVMDNEMPNSGNAEYNSNQPSELAQTAYLRLLVNEAVQREIINLTAPMRQQQQIIDGKLTQLNRDYGILTRDLEELDSVVRGDPELGIKGLMATVKTLSDQMTAYDAKLTTLTLNLRVGFLIVVALGVLDNARIMAFFTALIKLIGVPL